MPALLRRVISDISSQQRRPSYIYPESARIKPFVQLCSLSITFRIQMYFFHRKLRFAQDHLHRPRPAPSHNTRGAQNIVSPLDHPTQCAQITIQTLPRPGKFINSPNRYGSAFAVHQNDGKASPAAEGQEGKCPVCSLPLPVSTTRSGLSPPDSDPPEKASAGVMQARRI